MNQFTRWCYRLGLTCGALSLVSALAVIPFEFGMPIPDVLHTIAVQVFSVVAPAFMGLGVVLLIAAIVWLRSTWPRLSMATKVVSVLGLLASTFAGAYVFHWIFPSVLNDRRHT